jgi:hypothetical protein
VQLTSESGVQRDAKGRLLKGGGSLNRSGLDRKKLMMLRNLEGLTPKAIATLERLLDDPNPSAALGAAKEVLDRNLGKVKQNVQVDVTSTHVLHLEALQHLAEKKKRQVLEAQATEIPIDRTLYIEGLRGNDVTEAELVAPDNTSEAGAPPVPPEGPGAAADAPTPPATHKK